jgi:hypothetical protein
MPNAECRKGRMGNGENGERMNDQMVQNAVATGRGGKAEPAADGW